MSDFDWTYDITTKPLDGVKFKILDGDIYTIRDAGIDCDTCEVTLDGHSDTFSIYDRLTFGREQIKRAIQNGEWIIVG